ncbi:MAG: serpin family protein [Victivallaceae bacterium]|nr:serpin family protein [Victivallaceae bacterium]
MKHKKQIVWSIIAAALLALMIFCLIPSGKAAPERAGADSAILNVDPAFPVPDFNLAIKFLQAASAASDVPNFSFSLLTLSEGMTFMYAGAAGESLCDLSELFGFFGPPETAMREMASLNAAMLKAANGNMDIAAAVLFDKRRGRMFTTYADLLELEPLAMRADIDFSDPAAAGSVINDWAGEHTKGRIKDIAAASDITDETMCVILTAFYFKDVWADQFTPGGTIDFIVEPDVKNQTIPAMSRTGACPYAENDIWQYVELEFGNSGVVMALLLPRQFMPVPDLVNGTDGDEVAELLAAARAGTETVRITVPPFKVENSVNCKALMEQLGMHNWSGFQQMADPSPVIALIRQKNYFDFNAKGAEAASVNAVIGVACCEPEPEMMPKNFYADHPFLWFLLDKKSNTVLMTGWFAGQ